MQAYLLIYPALPENAGADARLGCGSVSALSCVDATLVDLRELFCRAQANLVANFRIARDAQARLARCMRVDAGGGDQLGSGQANFVANLNVACDGQRRPTDGARVKGG
jgi:hypothetical protein